MKKLLVTFSLLFIVFTASAQWRVAVEQTSTSIYSTFMLTETTGWQAGSSGKIFKTTDGGLTWILNYQNNVDGFNFTSVFFVNENVGYVAGNDATIAKTIDGGINWETIIIPAETSDLKDIHFVDENTGWAISAASNTSNVYKTIDGGTNWTLELANTTSDLEDIDFFDANHGVVCGGGVGVVDIYYTADGSTWTKSPVPVLGGFNYTRSDARAVGFADVNTVYITGWGSSVGMQPSIQLKSVDGGATWTFLVQQEQYRTYCNLNAIYIKDDQNGMSVGGAAYDGSVIVRTTDGGQNWIPTNAPFGGSCNSIFGIGDKVWVGMSGGTTVYSPDFGNTWQLLTPVPGTSLYSITAKGNTIYAAGYDGLVVKSTDKGFSWNSAYAYMTKSCPTIKQISFLDETIGYAARSYRGVVKTSDGTQSWMPLLTDTLITGPTTESVYFIDENNGYAVGREASNIDVIYKTTDGGSSWTETKNQFFKDLFGVGFYDINNGAVIGKDLAAGYTTDGGATWQASTLNGVPAGFTTNDFSKLTFFDGPNGVAVGQKMIFYTSDGGANWNYVTLDWLDKDIKNAAFENTTHGYAVGDKYLLETFDGGKSWTDIADTNLMKGFTLYDVSVDPDGYVWVCSSTSKVFTNAPVVSVEEDNAGVKTFELAQNYPNPFNPVTSIEFNIKSNSRVTLKVYDLLGREVATLINGVLAQGSHKIPFNASSLASGVYIYRLNAEGRSISKKMTLLK
ncbi:MAG: T9SS type A sorting domain-containing protein [Ignavibacteriaceae bacterium]|nr:T9SS type A sorting domain-containing protein [Ignavibacteriaceae bacterium]